MFLFCYLQASQEISQLYENSEVLFGHPQAKQGTTFIGRNETILAVVVLAVVCLNDFSQCIKLCSISKIPESE